MSLSVSLTLFFDVRAFTLLSLNLNWNFFPAYLWQLMRCNMMQLLRNLRFHSHGKEINDADILEWANNLVKNSRGQSRMSSFKVHESMHSVKLI